MNLAEIEYQDKAELTRNQVINLYAQCGWSSAEKPEQLLLALGNSHTLISAWHENLLTNFSQQLLN
jgi:hypothetical protein